jgi:hypothetical protein
LPRGVTANAMSSSAWTESPFPSNTTRFGESYSRTTYVIGIERCPNFTRSLNAVPMPIGPRLVLADSATPGPHCAALPKSLVEVKDSSIDHGTSMVSCRPIMAAS